MNIPTEIIMETIVSYTDILRHALDSRVEGFPRDSLEFLESITRFGDSFEGF